MTHIIALSIVCLAALIHASFQLSISTLTMMSGHAIGAGRSHLRLVSLVGSFITGAGIMTLLLISSFALLGTQIFGSAQPPQLVWAALSGLLCGVGVAAWLFYYRKEKGTSLWLPRHVAKFLATRSKKTRNPGEAFALGMMSVFGELLFIVAPITVAAFVLLPMDAGWQLGGILLYTLLATASLASIATLVCGGVPLSAIQRWRERNKKFLQFAAGSALIVLGFYLYVNEVLFTAVSTHGVML